jgi:peptidoglycan/LPS O-acetylase OafA/YrhL
MPRRIPGVPSGCHGRVTEADLKPAKTDVRAIYRGETAIASLMGKGYENSLERWLLYFNPAARLGEILVGLAAAHVYLVTRQRSATLGPAAASTITLAAIALPVGLHLWLYGVIAPGNSFVGRTASHSPRRSSQSPCI